MFKADDTGVTKAAEQAIAALGKNVRNDVLCAIRLQWGRAATTGGQPEIGKRELDGALELARGLGQPRTLGRCLYYRGALRYQQGEVEATDAIVDELLPLAQRSDDLELLVLALNMAGSIANMRSRFDVAENHLRDCLAAARQLGAPSLIAGILCSLNVPVYYRGGYAEAAALLEEAAQIFETIGRNTLATNVRSNLAAVLLAQGNPNEARKHIAIAIQMARDSGDQVQVSASLATLADILIEQRQFGDARTAAEESLSIATSMANPLTTIESLYLLATVEMRDGYVERVLPLLGRLRAALREHRLDVRIPMLALATAEWMLTAGDAAARPRALHWLAALSRLPGVDATLRDKAQRLLEREGEAVEDASTLAEIEADVAAFLDGA